MWPSTPKKHTKFTAQTTGSEGLKERCHLETQIKIEIRSIQRNVEKIRQNIWGTSHVGHKKGIMYKYVRPTAIQQKQQSKFDKTRHINGAVDSYLDTWMARRKKSFCFFEPGGKMARAKALEEEQKKLLKEKEKTFLANLDRPFSWT